MAMRFMIISPIEATRQFISQMVCTPVDTVVECISNDEAMSAINEFKPDFMTIDVETPGKCAFETMRSVRMAHPRVRMVCISAHDRAELRKAANEAGAAGYFIKDNMADLYLMVATKRLLSRLHF